MSESYHFIYFSGYIVISYKKSNSAPTTLVAPSHLESNPTPCPGDFIKNHSPSLPICNSTLASFLLTLQTHQLLLTSGPLHGCVFFLGCSLYSLSFTMSCWSFRTIQLKVFTSLLPEQPVLIIYRMHITCWYFCLCISFVSFLAYFLSFAISTKHLWGQEPFLSCQLL